MKFFVDTANVEDIKLSWLERSPHTREVEGSSPPASTKM